MAGHGSLAGLLPFKDANAVMLEMGQEIFPITKKANVPLLAGVCATDPFRYLRVSLVFLFYVYSYTTNCFVLTFFVKCNL